MQIALSDAKARLTELVRRAEQGEEVLLTRHGQTVVQLVPRNADGPTKSREERVASINAIMARGAMLREKYGLSARAMQDEMYDEDGMLR